MTDDVPFYERESLQRKRIETAGEPIASVREIVEEKRREKILALIDVRLRLADAHLGKSDDVSRAVAAHAAAVAEISALADAALALAVREPQARLAQLDAEIAACEREIENAEKKARPHTARMETLRGDLDRVSRKLGNQRVPDEETPALEKTQSEIKALLAALEREYEFPIKSLRSSLEKLEQLRKPLEREIANAIDAASGLESRVEDDDDSAPRTSRRDAGSELPAAVVRY